MPASANTDVGPDTNMGMYAIRALYSLMVVAVVWIYSTVDDVKTNQTRFESELRHTAEQADNNTQRISDLERGRWTRN